MVSFANLKPYMRRGIEDYGSRTSPEYESFQSKYRNFLKKICNENNFELVSFNKNHYCFSAFIKGNDKYVYLSISDVRYFQNEWYTNILVRSASDDRDYTGGQNYYTNLEYLPIKIHYLFKGVYNG